MAELTVQNLAESGLTATYENAASGGDTADNTGGKLLLHVKNDSMGSINVTVTAQSASTTKAGYGTVTKSNVVKAVGAGAEAFIGPFAETAFNNASGDIAITYSDATSVTIAALRWPG